MGRKSTETGGGVPEGDVAVQHRQRRLSKKPSREKHNRIFRNSGLEKTVRAVTPDSSLPRAIGSPGSEQPLPTSQPTSPGSQAYYGTDHLGSMANVRDEESRREQKRKSRSLPRQQGDNEAGVSPSSLLTKTRHRLESLSTGSPPGTGSENFAGSIGYPSVISSAPLLEGGDYRAEPIRPPQRPFSPPSSSDSRQSPLTSPTAMTSDYKKVLQLMKTTCGRMFGILFYRPADSEPWASGYCAINVAPGCLVCQVKGDVALTKTLIPDLRGCRVRTHYDSETQNSYLSVTTAHNDLRYHLRPPVPETFDSWLAALLCWQPLQPKTRPKPATVAAPTPVVEKRRSVTKRFLDVATQKKTAVVKIGKMLVWDGPIPPPLLRKGTKEIVTSRALKENRAPWRRISCTLHENGDLKLLAEADSSLISKISMSRLSRDAVQHLHPSVTGREFCVTVYPQYTATEESPDAARQLIFAFDTRQSADIWYVLLRAFAIPEIYDCTQPLPALQEEWVGSEQYDEGRSSGEMFRIERAVSMRLLEARFSPSARNTGSKTESSSRPGIFPGGCYAEILIGEDLRARTSVKGGDGVAFWAEEYQFDYLPSTVSTMSVLIKDGSPMEQEWTTVAHDSYERAHEEGNLARAGRIEVSAHDAIFGRVEVLIDNLDKHRDIERRWPIFDKEGLILGDLLMKVNIQETFVLMREQYKPLSDMLLNVSNGLTSQIAQVIGTELKPLSDVLLDLYQVLGGVVDWIALLVEEEIDGIYKETPPSRLRFMGRVYSSESLETGEDRELVVRDLSRSANNEANLLFRGNSLVTKALDAHMRRLGKDYLEETLGTVLRSLVAKGPDCEVDPVRLGSREQRERNWSTLNEWTSIVWDSISASASSCPSGLRILFRHIRSCAEDRYGTFIRTVKYTSVSGFLFLRFFCPAILNPEMFGLLPERPVETSRRSLTLIAKSLIVLANMTKFGAKEPWMEPMNRFLVYATPAFKAFIDEICSISSFAPSGVVIEPQNATPLQIMARLPPVSQEGGLSLPYLLDTAKLQARLVRLWNESAPSDIEQRGIEQSLKDFHHISMNLYQRARKCELAARGNEKPQQEHEAQWEEVIRRQRHDISLENPFEDSLEIIDELPPTQYPHPSGHTNVQGRQALHAATNSSGLLGDNHASPGRAPAAWDRGRPSMQPSEIAETSTFSTDSTNSSTISLEATGRTGSRPSPSSRDGPARHRIFELVNRPGLRMSRGRDEIMGKGESNDEL